MSLQVLVSQYRNQLQQYLGLEPYAAVALWDGIGQVSVWGTQAGFQAGPINVSYVTILHAVRVCQLLFNNMHPDVTTLQNWVALIVLSFGGTTISSILLARAPGWIAYNDPLTVYTVVYLLFRFTPILTILNAFGTPVRMLTSAGEGISRALAITSFTIDTIQTRSLPPINQSLVACILCGTLSGCGGGLVNSIFGVNKRNWTLGTPQATIDTYLASIIAIGYTTVTTLDLMDRSFAQGIACIVAASVLALNVLIIDLQAWRLNSKVESSPDPKSARGIWPLAPKFVRDNLSSKKVASMSTSSTPGKTSHNSKSKK